MRIYMITFLLLSSIAGSCLAQTIGTGSSMAGSQSQDNSETGAQGNIDNAAY